MGKYSIRRGLVGQAFSEDGKLKKQVIVTSIYPWVSIEEKFICAEVTDQQLEKVGYEIINGRKVVSNEGLEKLIKELNNEAYGFECRGLSGTMFTIFDEFKDDESVERQFKYVEFREIC